jgi:hypothetical protein
MTNDFNPNTPENSILEVAKTFFTMDDWPFSVMEDQTTLHANFQGENGRWACYVVAREATSQFIFYSVCPVNASEDKRPMMAEFITRANYGMFIGNFEMDYSDGEIRYKTSIDVEEDRLTPTLVRPLVYTNVIMMDKYLPGIMKVIYGNIPPAQVVDEIEGTT